jgi:hypothetical protein
MSAAVVGCAVGCVDTQPGLSGTQSLRVDLLSPTDPGAPDRRLGDDQRSLSIQVSALDEQGELDVGFSSSVDVYVQFLGGLTPSFYSSEPLAVVDLEGGQSAPAAIALPSVFGPTFLWVEDGSGEEATYATGTTPVLWYRDPFVVDISRPEDPDALDALEHSPLEKKQVSVPGSRYGANGRLVITSTYAQGYTVSDVDCQDAAGTPPCVAGAYDHVLVFTFSRPRDEQGRGLSIGQAITGFAGNVQEFNGLTEIGFPQTFVEGDPDVNEARIPAPSVVTADWLDDPIRFEEAETGLLQVNGGIVCPLDDDFASYFQWKLDIGRGCGDPINVITAGTITEFDPATAVGQTLPRVVGVLRPVNIGSFNVWIIHPRTCADLPCQ